MHSSLGRILLSGTLLTGIAAAAADPKAIERGKSEYIQACGFCHGNDGTGARGPDLMRSTLLAHDTNGDVIGPVIRNGRPEKEMPAFPKANVEDIAAYLHAQAQAFLNSARVPRDYPVEKLLTGNAAAGKQYFNGAGKCSSCHSPTGDLAGIGKKYSPIDLQSRFLYPGGVKSTVTITTKSGERASGTLVRADDYTVALRDGDGWYRSFSRKGAQVQIKDPLEQHRKLLTQYSVADVHNLFAYLESLK
jgi:cytochrome c oxidase cbb3-type subunit 3